MRQTDAELTLQDFRVDLILICLLTVGGQFWSVWTFGSDDQVMWGGFRSGWWCQNFLQAGPQQPMREASTADGAAWRQETFSHLKLTLAGILLSTEPEKIPRWPVSPGWHTSASLQQVVGTVGMLQSEPVAWEHVETLTPAVKSAAASPSQCDLTVKNWPQTVQQHLRRRHLHSHWVAQLVSEC